MCERTRERWADEKKSNIATTTAATTTTTFNIKTNFVMKMTEIEQMLASTAPDMCCLCRSLTLYVSVYVCVLESVGIV